MRLHFDDGSFFTATGRKPGQVGALFPFPLIVGGEFQIPIAPCTDSVGETVAQLSGSSFRLRIDAQRLPASASNVIARSNLDAERKLVITAQIDAYEDTPGASDNASGTVVLMLLAEMLDGYQGPYAIEIAALNGEDHYSACGQMDYLRRYGDEFTKIRLAVNVDDVGYVNGRSAYSFYDCPSQLRCHLEATYHEYAELIPGSRWFNGDHMIFVQNQIPSLAITAERMDELMRTVTHTAADTPQIIDCK